jgi:TolB protein
MKKILLLFFITSSAFGLIKIDIYKQNANALKIAVVQFQGDNKNLANIIATNLANSGKFAPQFIDNPNTQDKQFEAVIYGDIKRVGDKYQVAIFLKDIWTNKILFAKKITANNLSRKLAHHISDKMYFALLGERSAFETKIAYVEVDKYATAKYKLVVADSDGNNKKVIFSSPQPILSPTFSPDNNYIAYTAFSKNRSNVYVQNLYDANKIYTLPNFDGIASSPAWHPQGKSLLITLSKEGNQDIYNYNLSSGNLDRITKHKAIDTEASFSPDGKTIIWTSNRAGSPQIWQKTGTKISQIKISGRYNTSASFAPDGAHLALIHREFGSYKTAIYNIADKDLILLSNSNTDESPKFAPNSKQVIFSDGNNKLNIANIDGSHILKLSDDNKIIEPTWSHF